MPSRLTPAAQNSGEWIHPCQLGASLAPHPQAGLHPAPEVHGQSWWETAWHTMGTASVTGTSLIGSAQRPPARWAPLAFSLRPAPGVRWPFGGPGRRPASHFLVI